MPSVIRLRPAAILTCHAPSTAPHLPAEAARQLGAAGLAIAAAQAPSDRGDLVASYGRYFRRQGAFPILARRLASAPEERVEDATA